MTNKPEENQNLNNDLDETGKTPVEATASRPPMSDTAPPLSLTNGEDTNGKEPTASEQAVAETYRKKHKPTPLRFLALPPLYQIKALTLKDFDRLANKIRIDKTYESITPAGAKKSKAMLIIRACQLLFALVESGGLLKGAPEEEILKLRINVIEARSGFVQPTLLAEQTSADEGQAIEGTEEPDAEQISNPNSFSFRRALYAYGKLHLTTFIHYRMTVEKASDGDFLLPSLQITREEFADLLGVLPWLGNLGNHRNFTWKKIFRAWLKSELPAEQRRSPAWKNVAQIAAWRLGERELYPFLIAARRELYRSPLLPQIKFEEILKSGTVSFSSTRKSSSGINDDGAQLKDDESSADAPDFENEINADSTPEQGSEPEDKASQTSYSYVSRILQDLAQRDKKEKGLATNILEQSKSPQIAGSGEEDLRNLLRWTAANIKNLKISTAHTYAAKVLRALFSIPQIEFVRWETADVAEYLENYSTHASVTGVRNALAQFDEFLVKEKKAVENHIKWSSRALHAPVVYQVRDIISNAEYESIRKSVRESELGGNNKEQIRRDLAALTLLRRCGLRVGEAVYLTAQNFSGYKKWCLEIRVSKTRAGIRKLPLFLLLNKREITELRDFVETRKNADGAAALLFADDNNHQMTAAAFGRHIEKLLGRSLIGSETAHGLRHAFASSLFASFWLNLTKERRTEKEGIIYWTLQKYARPAIEGRAVTSLIYLQQLLGHADLRVTFERYIHLIELALADSVELFETDESNSNELLHKNLVAWLVGMDVEDLNKKFNLKSKKQIKTFVAAELGSSRLKSRS